MASQGIPAYIEGKTGYFASKEIQDVLLFLKVLDNPLQDIPLYGVMKSVFGGFTEEEVAVLRSMEEKDEPLYEIYGVMRKKNMQDFLQNRQIPGICDLYDHFRAFADPF